MSDYADFMEAQLADLAKRADMSFEQLTADLPPEFPSSLLRNFQIDEAADRDRLKLAAASAVFLAFFESPNAPTPSAPPS